MKSWQLQKAKARFSEFLDAALKKGPQVVTRRGVEEAVLVPMEEWRRLQRERRPNIKEWLLGEGPDGERKHARNEGKDLDRHEYDQHREGYTRGHEDPEEMHAVPIAAEEDHHQHDGDRQTESDDDLAGD